MKEVCVLLHIGVMMGRGRRGPSYFFKNPPQDSMLLTYSREAYRGHEETFLWA